MTENDYIVQTFSRNFSQYKDFNIALYGLGNRTGILINNFSDFHFTSLIDGYKIDGEVYGKKIVPIEKLLDYDTNIIIIVARVGSVKIIYNRISAFCKENKIKVFDIYGNDLDEVPVKIQNHSYFQLDMDKIKEEIIHHDFISFDIFDTLITRKVMHPYNVFQMAADRAEINYVDIVKHRIQAEWRLAEDCPTIFEIYNEVRKQTGISAAEANRMMEQEITIEMEVLVPRLKMVELFDYAISSGKKVYLISDMYLTNDMIQKLLESCGISGQYTTLVSCEYRTSKRMDLYNIYRMMTKGGSYLHIGDDQEADRICAQLQGIDSILIKSPSDMRDLSLYSINHIECESEIEQLELGILTASIFNDPFCLFQSEGRPVITDAYQFGYGLLAPVIVEFINWMIQELINTKIGFILFISRDGYLIKELYDNAVKYLGLQHIAPESVYFLTSRTANASAYITEEEDLRYIAALPFAGTPEELLKYRFCLREDEIMKDQDTKNMIEYILMHKEAIFTRSEQLRNQYLKYIQKIGIDKIKKVAIFDFVSTGTCQMCLEKIMSRKLEGYYFIRLWEDYLKKQQLTIHSYYNISDVYNQKNPVLENYFLLEIVIKALTPSITFFNDNGFPVYLNESRNKEEMITIREIQRAIINYQLDVLRILNYSYKKIYKSKSAVGSKIISFMNNQYTNVQIERLNNLIIRDEFCNRQINVFDSGN